MHAFETLVVLLFGAALLSLLARRIGAPYPALLALGGALAAFLPFAPDLQIPPELALALFIAPVLLDAAYDASLRDLEDNWLPIAFLTLVAVGLTVIGVAWTVKQFVPGLPWAAAVALGAIVAPPDAAAATAVLKAVRPPHRILIILQGESLFNDSSSLLIYRLAVAAVAAGGSLDPADIAAPLALATVGSVLLGWSAAVLYSRLTSRIDDAPTSIVLQFCGTFGIWMLAEALGVSAIITIVVYGITLARRASERVGAVVRAPAYAVWETAVFALNALAFLLVGMQVGPILENLSPAERTDYLGVAFAVLTAVIVVRIGWVMSYNTVVRLKNRWFGVRTRRPMTPPTVAGGLVVSWSGMRGVVSLAAAYALPAGFPGRDLLLVCTFAVVLGTLVLQGFTLGALIRWLGLRDDGSLDREIRTARTETARAALSALEGEPGDEAEGLRREFRMKLDTAEQAEAGDGRAETVHHGLRRRAIEAERRALALLRQDRTIGDDAYNQLEEELDRAELALAPVIR